MLLFSIILCLFSPLHHVPLCVTFPSASLLLLLRLSPPAGSKPVGLSAIPHVPYTGSSSLKASVYLCESGTDFSWIKPMTHVCAGMPIPIPVVFSPLEPP
eukprot:4173491-Pyramimonas_sp.AAC.1